MKMALYLFQELFRRVPRAVAHDEGDAHRDAIRDTLQEEREKKKKNEKNQSMDHGQRIPCREGTDLFSRARRENERVFGLATKAPVERAKGSCRENKEKCKKDEKIHFPFPNFFFFFF